MHAGHHTYHLGGPHLLKGGGGRLFVVEQQFTPPTSFEEAPFRTPVHVQTSLDGRTWHDLEDLSYLFVGDPTRDGITIPTRQEILFELPASDEPFAFLRFHEPRSAARGLSGFLDASRFDLLVDPIVGPAPAPLANGTIDLSCTRAEHVEAFFEEHPCTFGGINRYDSPSFFHTYALDGPANLTRIEGTVAVAPWRTDDFMEPLLPPLAQVTITNVFVETSEDGERWTRHSAVTVRFGVLTTFARELPGDPARFVRLVPDLHPRFHQYQAFAPNHHPEAYFLHSELLLQVGEPSS